VVSANGHPDFPIQNLPYGVVQFELFQPEIVVAIGPFALRLRGALEAGWGEDLSLEIRAALMAPWLNELAALRPADWTAVRLALSDALADPAWEDRLRPAMELIPDDASSFDHNVPVHVGDYTDFYASIYHATNVGALFRPDQPLLPNYKWVPIGYHGRASTIDVSFTVVDRPRGQIMLPGATAPEYLWTRALDYEVELGLILGDAAGLRWPTTAETARDRIFGVVLLNDWSARDIQSWEYQPLGPFLSKSFRTTVSPWIVTSDALRPFEVPMPRRPAGDPAPLEHLTVPDDFTWSIQLETQIETSGMREQDLPIHTVSRVNYADAMYWSPAQLVTHHTSNGCIMNVGDLLGTGTISGPTPDSCGCLLEMTKRGTQPIILPGGESRGFLEDNDVVQILGYCEAPHAVRIGFGDCSGSVETDE
jgi:fumarylacetoacetase